MPTAAVSQPAGAEQSGPASDAGTAETAPTEEEATDIQRWARYVPVGHMRAGRFQTRERMDSEEISALSESIRQRGILQPILVRRHPDIVSEYEIIAGERRWRAAQQAELSEAPVVVLDLTDHDAMEIALVENMQRRDLSALEEAKGFRRLIEDYSHTQDDLARAVGKSRSHIANTLRLIRLPGPVKNMLRDGQLTAGHARALLNARHPAALAREVVARGLNVRQTESLAQTTLTGQTETRPKPEKDGDILAIEQELSNLLGLRVRIHIRDDRGTVSIRFRGLQALGELVSRLQQTSES